MRTRFTSRWPSFLSLAANILLLLAAAGASEAASFSCEGPLRPVEQMVCDDPELSSQDEVVSKLYIALRVQDAADTLRDQQRAWLLQRDRCETSACLQAIYADRLKILNEMASADSSASDAANANAPSPNALAATDEGSTASAAAEDPHARGAPNRPTSPLSPSAAPPQSGVPWILLFLLIVGVIVSFLSALGKRQRRIEAVAAANEAFSAANSVIVQYSKTLTIQRRQKIVTDAYGTVDVTAWRKEAEYFYRTKVEPVLTDGQKKIVTTRDPYSLIEDALAKHGIDLDDLSPSFKSNDAIQYEHHCAELLRKAGWNSRVTKGSGDQGSDVIAERGAVRIVLQCKLYAYPVGNKAVQEVSAARAHEGADFAACVSNSTYTSSAKALAVTNAVALLHHDQLMDWASQL